MTVSVIKREQQQMITERRGRKTIKSVTNEECYQPACPTWNRMVLGEKLKLEMFAPSFNHYRRER